MTSDKARKRAIRARMTKTGESYTGARRHVRGYPELPPRFAEPGVSEASILRATGQGWDHWLGLLDSRGVEGFSHHETAAWLQSAAGLSGWWAQAVTVGFERARGLRQVHQTAAGFSVGVTKTLPVPAARLWEALASERERAAWLEQGTLAERSNVPERSARFDFHDDRSRVAAYVSAKGDGKASVTIQHERLRDRDEVEAMRAFWRERLVRLADHLTTANSRATPG